MYIATEREYERLTTIEHEEQCNDAGAIYLNIGGTHIYKDQRWPFFSEQIKENLINSGKFTINP